MPRKADVVLLRRVRSGTLPFTGLWRWLTAWNILEFKGPSVTPRSRDLSLLFEVGLGIDRRLQAERRKKGQRPLPKRDVSFWYLANQLGRRFLREAERQLRGLEPLAPGAWRGHALGFSCLLVSTVELPRMTLCRSM